MMWHARAAVFSGTTWLSIPSHRRPDLDGKVLIVENDGQLLCPAFCVDAAGDVIPAVAEVLGVFLDSTDPFEVAIWFESVNSVLGGRQPRVVLGSDPDAVIAAAWDELTGILHG